MAEPTTFTARQPPLVNWNLVVATVRILLAVFVLLANTNCVFTCTEHAPANNTPLSSNIPPCHRHSGAPRHNGDAQPCPHEIVAALHSLSAPHATAPVAAPMLPIGAPGLASFETAFVIHASGLALEPARATVLRI